MFYYRGNILFKVRYGQYKANFYSWGSPLFAQKLDYHYCVGQHVVNVTEDELQDHTKQPILFHLGKDPGERWKVRWVFINDNANANNSILF